MIEIDPNTQTERQNYTLLIGSVVPRPIAFVTTVGKDGVINGAPFSYFNVVTSNPPMLSISVQRKNGAQKDTARNIIARNNFVIHTVSKANLNQINQTAANLAPYESEIALANLQTIPSKKIATPGVKEAKVRFECVLEKHLPLSEANAIHTDFFIGKVVCMHVAKSVYDEGKIVYDELQAMSRLAGSDYAEIGSVSTIKRPD